MMMQQRPFTLASSCFGFLLTLLVAVSMRAEPSYQPVRIGPEFQANTFTTDNQLDPAVAMDDAGNFVITWYSVGQDGSAGSIFAQRFDAQGTPLSREFQVNDYRIGGQQHPAIAMNGTGHFVIVWHSMHQDGDQLGLFAQRFNPQGERLGKEFQVNTVTAGNQLGPVIAMDAAGHFVISWSSWGQDGDAMGIFAQRFDADGAKIGPEFQVNHYTNNSQLEPAIAVDAAGHFVISWSSRGQDGDAMGIFAQRFDVDGTKVGPEFHVNTTRVGSQHDAAISMDIAGDFIISWSSRHPEGSDWDIYGQRFDAQGTPLGHEFQVNTHTGNSQQLQVSAVNQAGHMAIAWCSRDQDGDAMGIFAQRFDATGTPLGEEFQVNSFTASEQAVPSIAMNDAGHLVVVWHSQSQDGSGFGIFAQRFQLRGFGEEAAGLANEGTR
jgi:hypothetical protein